MADSVEPSMDVKRQGKIEQFRELFNCSEAEAVNMLETFSFDLEEASSAMASMRDHPAVHPLQETAPGGETGKASDVIDLTSRQDDDDLKRALRLSLQDQKSNGISYEDEQLSKAVEESLAESKQIASLMGFSTTSYFTDPLNPHERKRLGGMPVGIKNMGNTCWFNVAIQAFFHIPSFRRLLLGFSPPIVEQGSANEQFQHCVTFVQELQKLFSLLMLADTKYVEPSDILKLLQTSGTQQDIAEFIHKLLEWLEEAYQYGNKVEGSKNPVKELFFGQYQTSGISEGNSFVNESLLGGFPLDVKGCATLYDSLSSATYNRGGQSRRRSLSQDTIHESWFTHLPPVMILELSRFEYSQDSKQVLKINDSLDFERVMYMDRFLLQNREATLASYGKELAIKSALQTERDKYQKLSNYGGRPLPLLDVLSLMKTYASERVLAGEDSDSDVRSLCGMLDRWTQDVTKASDDVLGRIESHEESLSALYSDPSMRATAYHLHAVCVHQGDASLGHYWVYVNPRTSGLPIRASNPNPDVEDMDVTPTAVKDPSTDKFTFKLDSEASPGDVQTDTHISTKSAQGPSAACEQPATACITPSTGEKEQSEQTVLPTNPDRPISPPVRTDPPAQQRGRPSRQQQPRPVPVALEEEELWYKFNDVNVSAVPWSEVRKEACGQGDNTSAYCFVYVAADAVPEGEERLSEDSLTSDLLAHVQQHNDRFLGDLTQWDSQSQTNPSPALPGPVAASSWIEPASAGGIVSDVNGSDMSKALARPRVDALIERKLHSLCPSGLDFANVDARYMSPTVFYLKAGAPHCFCQCLALDHIITDLKNSDKSTSDSALLLATAVEMQHVLRDSYEGTFASDEKTWSSMFRHYQQLCLHVLSCYQALEHGDFPKAINQVLAVFAMNVELLAVNDTVGLPVDFVTKLLAGVAKKFNSYALAALAEDSFDVLSLCTRFLVPGVQMLSQCDLPFAKVTLESIRRDWCALVDKEGLSDDVLDKLADLIPCLMDDYSGSLTWQAQLDSDIVNSNPEYVCKTMHDIKLRILQS